MELKLPKDRAEAIGLDKLRAFGIGSHTWNYKNMGRIDLRTLNEKQLKELRELLESKKTVHGVKMMLYDLGCYERAKTDPNGVKVRNIRTFTEMLVQFIKPSPHKFLFKKDEDNENIRHAYYVNKITFWPPKRIYGGRVAPAHVVMELYHDDFKGRHSTCETWYQENVKNRSVSEILTARGYYLETEEFFGQYQGEVARWSEMVRCIGKQYLATGTGIKNTDGNNDDDDDEDRRWYWRYWGSSTELSFIRDGEPSKVVIDVFKEGDKKDDRNEHSIDQEFWGKKVEIADRDDNRSNEDDELEELEEEEAEFNMETGANDAIANRVVNDVAVHPYVVVFDLRRHMRLSTHVNNLEEYKYDTKMADKLVLPDESKHLVEILVEHREGGFNDIVRGKAGGAVVLLCGQPGTGKTLTAEVFAEAQQKPLYSVQASQLGTSETKLEKNLMKTLARGKRWGAIMLIDEADVYVRQRGDDIQQNAIVGVFLRVLEYHASILFMTTNKPEDVDDAVASRCIARLVYTVPPVEDQKRIWKILCDVSNININDKTIDAIVSSNDKLTGRDIKNLVKLVKLFITSGDKKGITPDVVKFVKQFKPTN